MSSPSGPVPLPAPPAAAHAHLLQLLRGAFATQLVGLAASLRIADLLCRRPRSSDELAAELGLHARSLHRALRGLALLQIVLERDDGRFALAPAGELLCQDVPGSLHDLAAGTVQITAPALQGLQHTLRTGQPAFPHVFGATLFEHFARDREIGGRFDRFLGGVTTGIAGAALQAYDFSGIGTLVDVGGGNGTFLATALRAHPRMRGVLLDARPVVAGAAPRLAALGVTARVEVVPGDLRVAVPRGGDAYLLSRILHDWDDETCVRILRNCRAAMGGRGKLLVVEQLLPEKALDDPAAVWGDLDMLTLLPGRERTLDEYRALLAAAGFALRSTTPVPSPMGGTGRFILEAAPRE